MIPSLMRADKRWVVWRFSADGKKLPHDPRDPKGRAIDTTDEKFWVDYDTAAKVVEAGGVDGLGFVLGDGWAGVDLDDVRDPATGVITPAAKVIVQALDSYTEISPSGTGLKLFIKAWLGKNHKRVGLEIYGYSRYFTVTGLHMADTPTEPQARSGELTALVQKEFGSTDVDEPEGDATEIDVDDLPDPDAELIEGGRNNALARIGGSLRRLDFGDEELLSALQAFNHHRCRPPLPDPEVKTIARSVGRYAPSKAERAIDWMNQRHAILMENGKTIVITEGEDPVLKRTVLDRGAAADIRLMYCDHPILLKVAGKKVSRPLGDYWLNHPGRRKYTRVVFDPEANHAPDVLNLWKGLAVKPEKGSWSALRDHIHHVIAGGRQDVFEYFIGWMARAVQKPGRPGEVGLVMKGAQGAGKGILARSLGHVFGQHFVHVARSHHLTGHFNAHLQDAVLVFADEAVWGGDKTAEGALKALITEPTLQIERKGRDTFNVKNVIHLMVASNNEWAVPAGLDDRRFCIVEVLGTKVGDHKYFRAIREEMNRGGYAAMLFDLMAYDLKTFDHRKPPQTDAALQQKLLGMSPTQRWWFEKLKDGRLLPADKGWEATVPRTALHENYVNALDTVGIQRKSLETELGIQLRNLLGDLPMRETRRQANGGRQRCWIFPPLTECREQFERLVKKKITWGDEEIHADDTTQPEPPKLDY
jgi:Family of unknown function (DUF5906)/Primase C terminal 1 (PriCT-1)